MEINRGTSSNTSGYFTITNLEPGSYTLVATYIGYRRFETSITLEPGENLRLDIELIPESVMIEEIVVESDRKSTRLNSSHVAISYAVSCLKKKMHKA